MKKIIVLCISSIVFAASSSFNVEGMMCGVSCVNKLKAQVNTLEGIKSCNVSFEKGMMTVDYDESKLNNEKIINLFANNSLYKVTTLDAKSSKCCANSSQSCSKSSKSCCTQEKPKAGFFKKLFSWF